MRRKAFSLIELLTVLAIIAVLAAILMPVVISVKRYAQQYVAGEAMMKLATATSLYMGDYDDTYPLAYYPLPGGSRQNWFGVIDQAGQADPETSLLRPYVKGKIQRDWSLNAKPWQGDASGYGYNWGYLGSDFYLGRGESTTLECKNPVSVSQLAHDSDTLEYTTSSFYFAPWLPRGDGAVYLYGFVDPPSTWLGNPTMDFRHMGDRKVDLKKKEVTFEGQALVVCADGHLRTMRQPQVKNTLFERE